MKTSELIAELHRMLATHGDLPVAVERYDNEGSYYMEVKELLQCHFNKIEMTLSKDGMVNAILVTG